MHRAVTIAAVILASLIAVPAFAGSLCGTVRDAVTSQVIPRAGLFLRTPAGAYTGFHTATDSLGHYCLDAIPPGTYDLEVRVDNYRTAFVRNIEIEGDVSGADVEIPAARFQLLPPFPNPALDHVRIALRLADDSAVTLVVTDVQGRFVHGWESTNLPAGDHEFSWDLRDTIGRSARTGRYFVRFSAGNVELVRSFVHLAR